MPSRPQCERERKVLKYLLDVPVCMVEVLDSAWASLWRASAVEDCSSLRVGVVGACGMGVVGVWHECSGGVS